jgi:signal-transduction protein with cAMP-binding, CBS, and nucleotidyltransferase domain
MATSPPTEAAEVRTLESVRVSEAMHHGVLSCGPETPLGEVAATMAAHRVHCIVVVAFPGHAEPPHWSVVSDLDLVAAAGRDDLTAGEIAGTEALTVTPDATLAQASRLMTEHQVAHLVVVSRESGRPVGVLSTLDVATFLASGAG